MGKASQVENVPAKSLYDSSNANYLNRGVAMDQQPRGGAGQAAGVPTHPNYAHPTYAHPTYTHPTYAHDGASHQRTALDVELQRKVDAAAGAVVIPDQSGHNLARHREKVGAALATQQILGSNNRRQWLITEPGPTFPIDFERRGISLAQYNADFQRIKAAVDLRARNTTKGLLVALLFSPCTLCISCLCIPCFAQCLASPGESPRDVINDLNTRYRSFGISWDITLIPHVGEFISYEW